MSISSIGFTLGRGATIIPGIASALRFGRRTRVGDLGDVGLRIGGCALARAGPDTSEIYCATVLPTERR